MNFHSGGYIHHLGEQPDTFPVDMVHLVEEAFLVLSCMYPQLAYTLWTKYVEGRTEKEIAQTLGVDERSVERWLNGYRRHDGADIWGAKDYMSRLLQLLAEAEKLGQLSEVLFLFNMSKGKNFLGVRFCASIFDILCDAHDKSCLRDFLLFLQRVKEEKGDSRYLEVLSDLLINWYGKGRLEEFFVSVLRKSA